VLVKIQAAVAWEAGTPLAIEELELGHVHRDAPGRLTRARTPAARRYGRRSSTTTDRTQIVCDDQGMPVSFAPGIIDVETFQKLQAKMDARATTKVRTASQSLLLNVAYCECGAPYYLSMVTHTLKTGEQRTKEYYKTTRAKIGPCNGTRSIRTPILDELVQRELLKTLGDCKVLIRVTNTERRSELEAERRAVAAQIVELTQDMFVKGRPRENHNELMESLQARHAELQEALETEDDLETVLVETGELFRGKWESMNTLERRLWLMDAGVRVVALKGRRPPVKFLSLPKTKRSLIAVSDGDVHAVIYLGNLGEMLRRAQGRHE
jgi:hypothetical protein